MVVLQVEERIFSLNDGILRYFGQYLIQQKSFYWIMVLPKFRNKVFLAPMAGVCDPAFRLMCAGSGAGLVFTEFMSIHAIESKQKLGRAELENFIPFSEKERPIGIQLFGNDVKTTKLSVEAVSPYFDIIDFNMGCPAPTITAQMAGSALLQKPEHMEKLLSTLVSSSSKPVSIKMRAGVERDKKLFLKIGKIAENVGVEMMTLHPRTVEQGYSGKSDWSLIRELKEKVSVPVVGNGDINMPEDAKRMFEETGCDYIMIGRASMGNPEIFAQVNDYLKSGKYSTLSGDEKKQSFLEYLRSASEINVKLSEIRNQAMYFTKGITGSVDMRRNIATTKSIEEIKKIFQN
jgi:tRNA-dihydrouridine synthase B